MFQKVDEEKFPDLKKVLEARLPKSAMLHNVLTLLQTRRLPEIVTTTIYAFDGQIQVEGASRENEAFIIAIQSISVTKKTSSVILSTPVIPTVEMINSLEELVDWKHGVTFCAVDILYSNLLEDLAKKHGTMNPGPCEFMTMSLPQTKMLQIRAPNPSVEIKELSPSDAELVTNRWQHSQPDSEEKIIEMIRSIGSAGVYVDKTLVSMVVMFAMGSIHALFTEEDCRGKGYGKMTMQKMCQLAGERGLVPNVQVELGNTPSTRLMESVGLTYSHNIVWVFYKPQLGFTIQ